MKWIYCDAGSWEIWKMLKIEEDKDCGDEVVDCGEEDIEEDEEEIVDCGE